MMDDNVIRILRWARFDASCVKFPSFISLNGGNVRILYSKEALILYVALINYCYTQ